MEIADGSPGLVFWIGDESLTEPQLYRHLRTLNKVLIPVGYGDDDDDVSSKPRPAVKSSAFGETPASDNTHEAVQFRHADGNVLAEVMPVLTAAQFSRLFGPAQDLVFIAQDHPAEDGSILYEAPLPQDAPEPKPGLLRLSMEQMEGVEAARLNGIANDIAIELHEDIVGGEMDPKFRSQIKDAVLEADRIGATNYEAYREWAYLNFAFGPKFLADANSINFVQNGYGSKHEKTGDMINHRISFLSRTWTRGLVDDGVFSPHVLRK